MAVAIGQIVFNTAGTFPWVVPADVTSICGVAVGPASRNTSSGGGGLSWRNNIAVTPGETLTVQIGVNQASSVASTHTILYRGSTILLIAEGANGINGGRGGKNANIVNGGGGNGGNSSSTVYSGGGGAGGYTGNGGDSFAYTVSYTGGTGQGGGGGGGGSYYAGGGGGVGLMGQGANGIGGTGTNSSQIPNSAGRGGSGGSNGTNYINDAAVELGGTYGGGSAYATTLPAVGSQVGAMRLIWGPNRAFPSTGTEDQTPVDPNEPVELGRFQFTTGTNTQVVPAEANSAYLILVGAGAQGGGSLSHGEIVVTPGETLTVIVDSRGSGVYGNREGNPMALLGYAHAAVGSAGGVAWRGGPYFKAHGINPGANYGPGGGGAAGYSAAGNSGAGGSGKSGSSGSSFGSCNSVTWGNGGGGVGLNGEGPSGVNPGAGGSGGGNGTSGFSYATGSTCMVGNNTYSFLASTGGNGGSFGGGSGSGGIPGAGGIAITFYDTVLYGNANQTFASSLAERDQEANLSTEFNSLAASANTYTGPTSSNDEVMVTAIPYEGATSSDNEIAATALEGEGATTSDNEMLASALELGDLQIYSNQATSQALAHGDLPDVTSNSGNAHSSSLTLGDLQIYSQRAFMSALAGGDAAADSQSNEAVATALTLGDLQIYSNRVRISVLADNEINTVMFQVDERLPGTVSVSSTWMVTSDFVGKYRLDDSYACDIILNGVLQTKAPGKILELNLGDAIQFSATADSEYGASIDFTINGDNVLYVTWANKASNQMDYINFGFFNNVLPFTFTTEARTVTGLDPNIDYEETPYVIFSRNARLQFYVNDSEVPVSEASVVNGDTIRLYWRGPMPNTFPDIVTYYLESTYLDEFYAVAEISARAFELGDPFLRPDITYDFDAEPEYRVTELVGIALDALTPRLLGTNSHWTQLNPVLTSTLSFWTDTAPLLQGKNFTLTQLTPLIQGKNFTLTQLNPLLQGHTEVWTQTAPLILGKNNVQVTDVAFDWAKTTISEVQNPDYSVKVHETLHHGYFSMTPFRNGAQPSIPIDTLVVALKTSSGATVDGTFVKGASNNLNVFGVEPVRGSKSIFLEGNSTWDVGTNNPALFTKHWENSFVRSTVAPAIDAQYNENQQQDIKLAIDHVYQNAYPQRNWLGLDAEYSRLTYSVWFTSYPEVPYLAQRAQKAHRVPVDLPFIVPALNAPEAIDHSYLLYKTDGKLFINDVWQWYQTDAVSSVSHQYDLYKTDGVFGVSATYKKHLDSQAYYFQVDYVHTQQVTSYGVNSTFFEWTKAVRIPVGIGFQHVVYNSVYTFEVDYVTGPDDSKTFFIDYEFITRPHVTAPVDNSWGKTETPSYAWTAVTPTLADSKIITVSKNTGVVQHNIQVVDGPSFTLIRDPLTQIELLDGQAGYHTQEEAIAYAAELGFAPEQIRLFQYNGKYGFTTDPEAFAAVCRIEPPEDGITKVIFWR